MHGQPHIRFTGNILLGSMKDGAFRGCVIEYPIVYYKKLVTWLFLSYTYLLTACSRVLLEKLTRLQLAKKFPAFHGTQRFITALTSFRHLSLSWVSPIQSIHPHPTSWRSVLILSNHLRRLPSGLLPSGFPSKTPSAGTQLFVCLCTICFYLLCM